MCPERLRQRWFDAFVFDGRRLAFVVVVAVVVERRYDLFDGRGAIVVRSDEGPKRRPSDRRYDVVQIGRLVHVQARVDHILLFCATRNFFAIAVTTRGESQRRRRPPKKWGDALVLSRAGQRSAHAAYAQRVPRQGRSRPHSHVRVADMGSDRSSFVSLLNSKPHRLRTSVEYHVDAVGARAFWQRGQSTQSSNGVDHVEARAATRVHGVVVVTHEADECTRLRIEPPPYGGTVDARCANSYDDTCPRRSPPRAGHDDDRPLASPPRREGRPHAPRIVMASGEERGPPILHSRGVREKVVPHNPEGTDASSPSVAGRVAAPIHTRPRDDRSGVYDQQRATHLVRDVVGKDCDIHASSH